jgi:FAD/FMN-containing dehydrogenase
MTTQDPTTAAAPQHPTTVLPGEHWGRLRTSLTGRLVLPDDPDWDAARSPWQVLVDQQPAAVVIAADQRDVIATVKVARTLGLHVAPQSTGHAAGTIGTLADTILLKTSGLRDVEIDRATGRARVGAGATWAEVAAAGADHGLAAVAGMSGTVGVVGFVLGGGLGWFARSHGLAANSVVGLEAVDAAGRVVSVHAGRHADLFWAARGGIAPVVVTSVEVQLYPIDEVWAGGLLWPIERAAEVAHAWREWIATVPDTVTSLLRVLRYPPIPDIPDALRGRAFVAVEAAIQADALAVERVLEPLRSLAPELDSVRPMPPAQLATVHGDPEQPSPAYGDSTLLTEITPASIDAFLEAVLDPSAAALVSVELRQLGGMLTPGRADGGAVSAIDGAGLVFAVGIVPVPAAKEAVRAAAAAVAERLRPYATTTRVKNFTEVPAPAHELFGAATERLRIVAVSWDPERIIRVGHPLD